MDHIIPPITDPLGRSWRQPSRSAIEIDDTQLLETPAAIRFISAEPLLGEVDLIELPREPNDFDRAMPGFDRIAEFSADVLFGCNSVVMEDCEGFEEPSGTRPKLDWVIVGGESGAGARPMHPDWARWLRGQCVAAAVPFFFKQWGEWAPIQYFDQHDKPMLKISLPNESNFKPSHREIVFTLAGPEPAKTSVNMQRVGKKAAGALLDGREWRQFPEVRA